MARQGYAVFSEGVIGRLKLKNRLVRAATYEAAMTKDGRITETMLDLYQALTQGGVGTIITGQMAVALAGKGMPKQACVYDDRFIPEISQIAATVHFAAREAQARPEEKPTEKDVLDTVMKWKQKRRPPLDEKEVALTVRNLNMLSWIGAKVSNDLPITEEEILHV